MTSPATRYTHVRLIPSRVAADRPISNQQTIRAVVGRGIACEGGPRDDIGAGAPELGAVAAEVEGAGIELAAEGTQAGDAVCPLPKPVDVGLYPAGGAGGEFLDAMIEVVRHVDVPSTVHSHTLRAAELSGEAAQPDAPRVHSKGNLLHHAAIQRGDIAEAFSHCSVVVEETYTTPFIEHAFLEPESGIAFPTQDGGVMIQMDTQCAFDDRTQLSEILALPEDKIRVVQSPMGGAFGGKEDMILQQYLSLGVLRTGRPVKMVLTREESLRAHPKRHTTGMHFKTGTDCDGHAHADLHANAERYGSRRTQFLAMDPPGRSSSIGCHWPISTSISLFSSKDEDWSG